MEESLLGKLVIIGTGEAKSAICGDKYPAVAVWLFEGLRINLKWEVFPFRFNQYIGPRRIDHNTCQRAQRQGDSKVLEIGESLLLIEDILGVYVQSHGFIALCKDNANTAIIAKKMEEVVQKLFGEKDNLQVEIVSDDSSSVVLGQFMRGSA